MLYTLLDADTTDDAGPSFHPRQHTPRPETGAVTVKINDGETVTIQGRPTATANWVDLTAFDESDSRVVRLMHEMRASTTGTSEAYLEV